MDGFKTQRLTESSRRRLTLSKCATTVRACLHVNPVRSTLKRSRQGTTSVMRAIGSFFALSFLHTNVLKFPGSVSATYSFCEVSWAVATSALLSTELSSEVSSASRNFTASPSARAVLKKSIKRTRRGYPLWYASPFLRGPSYDTGRGYGGYTNQGIVKYSVMDHRRRNPQRFRQMFEK